MLTAASSKEVPEALSGLSTYDFSAFFQKVFEKFGAKGMEIRLRASCGKLRASCGKLRASCGLPVPPNSLKFLIFITFFKFHYLGVEGFATKYEGGALGPRQACEQLSLPLIKLFESPESPLGLPDGCTAASAPPGSSPEQGWCRPIY